MSAEILTKALEQHGAAVTSLGDSLDEVKARLQELEQKSAGGMIGTGYSGGTADSLFKTMSDSESMRAVLDKKSSRGKNQVDSRMLLERKNTILGESGSPQEPSDTLTQASRRPGVVAGAFRSLSLLDFMPMETTDSNMVEYTRESAYTNSAAETAEGTLKPETDVTFELVTDPVRTVPHFMKVSRQAWDDAPWLQGYLTERMRHAIQARLQSQIINGDGSSPNLAGITASGRHTVFTPETGESALDALNRCKYDLVTADYAPDFILINPKTWGAIERVRRGTSDEAFQLGEGGAAAYVASGMPPVAWSVPVIPTNDLAQGKFIMGSRDAMRLVMRQQATVELFEQNSDDVQKNLLTIRAELRAALAVLVPAAVKYGDLTV